MLIISKGRNLLAAVSGVTTFTKFRTGNDCTNWHSSPTSASGRDCHWKEWPSLTPTLAAPGSCPGPILLSSCASLPCGSSFPGLRHKPRWKPPLQATPLHWVGTRIAVLVQSRTWCENGRGKHGDGQLVKSRGCGALDWPLLDVAWICSSRHWLLLHTCAATESLYNSFLYNRISLFIAVEAQVYLAISQLFIMEPKH